MLVPPQVSQLPPRSGLQIRSRVLPQTNPAPVHTSTVLTRAPTAPRGSHASLTSVPILPRPLRFLSASFTQPQHLELTPEHSRHSINLLSEGMSEQQKVISKCRAPGMGWVSRVIS